MFNETENQTGENQQTQNPTPSQDSENLEKRIEELNQSGNKSGKRIGIIILLIFLGGVVVGSYYFWNDITNFLNLKEEVKEVDCATDTEECPDGSFVKRISPSCEFAECPLVIDGENTIDKVDISDWQTYRNEEYGFEVQYPEGREIKEYSITDDNDSFNINRKSIVFPIGNEFKYVMHLNLWKNPDKLALVDWLKKTGIDMIININISREPNMYIDKAPVLRILSEGKRETKHFYYFVYQDKGYLMFLEYKSDLEFNKEVEKSLDQIISSFKFLQDTDTDGLFDDREAEYGCDLNNPDTDGDGYLDGDEVKNGYNPNGEGKL